MSGPGIPWETVENALQLWIVNATGFAGTSVIWAVQNDVRPQTPFVTVRLDIRRIGQDFVRYKPAPLVLSPGLTVTAVNVGASTITCPGHGLGRGDGPFQFLDVGGTLPAPLALLTNYWVYPVDSNTLKLCTTFLNAMAGTPVTVTLSSSGSGTITVNTTPQSVRRGQELTAQAQGMRRGWFQLQAFAAATDGALGPSAIMDAIMSQYPFQAGMLRAAGVGVLSFSDVTLSQETVNSTILEPRALMTVTLSFASNVEMPETIIDYATMEPEVDGEPEAPFTVGPLVGP